MQRPVPSHSDRTFDTLDVLQILEMAASDFLLPPLRRSRVALE